MYPEDPSQYKIPNFPVNPGDYIVVNVTASALSNGTAYWYVTDVTQNMYSNFYQSMSGLGTGSTADYILEDTAENGQIYELANFGVQSLMDEGFTYSRGGQGQPGAVSHAAFYMTGNANDHRENIPVATPNPFTSPDCGGFNVTRSNVY